jgi:hypothetical protein
MSCTLPRETARERGLASVVFEVADVGHWAGPGEYDFVYCRFLLQHLAQPAGLLRRMWEAARPAGVLAVEDGDLEGLLCDPDNAGFSFYKRMWPYWRRATSTARVTYGRPISWRTSQATRLGSVSSAR